MKEALAAKAVVKETLRAAGVEAACGITKAGSDYAVKVNLSSSADAGKVPAQVSGMPVVVAITGPVRAMAARKTH